MTYWHHAYCVDCKSASPPLFTVFNGEISRTPLGDSTREAAGRWTELHTAPGHDVRLVHENDGNQLGTPKFPDADLTTLGDR